MSKNAMTEVLEAIEEVAKHIGRFDPPMQPNYLVLSLGNQADTLRRLISKQEQGEPVAHRLLRKTMAGEWKHDERYWVDGAPSESLLNQVNKDPDNWRLELAFSTLRPKQEQGEPVGTIDVENGFWTRNSAIKVSHLPDGAHNLYTTPQQPKPMGNVLKVERISDQSVLVVFRSCRAASEFETKAAHGIKAVA